MIARPLVAVTLFAHDTRRCRAARDLYLGSILRAGGERLPVDPGATAPDASDARASERVPAQ